MGNGFWAPFPFRSSQKKFQNSLIYIGPVIYILLCTSCTLDCIVLKTSMRIQGQNLSSTQIARVTIVFHFKRLNTANSSSNCIYSIPSMFEGVFCGALLSNMDAFNLVKTTATLCERCLITRHSKQSQELLQHVQNPEGSPCRTRT